MAGYQLEITDLATAELKSIRVFDRRRIIDAIYNQLANQPYIGTRNRKRLAAAVPEFEHLLPIWELRVANIVNSMM